VLSFLKPTCEIVAKQKIVGLVADYGRPAQLVAHHAFSRLKNDSYESTKHAGYVGLRVYKSIDYSTSTPSSTINRWQHFLLGHTGLPFSELATKKQSPPLNVRVTLQAVTRGSIYTNTYSSVHLATFHICCLAGPPILRV
jgi:hypothetical protein